jgi:predicted esterase
MNFGGSGSRPPHVLEPTDPASGRPATFIFLHGYGDDAEGLPLGLAQQFQFNHKLPHLRWVLPNAPRDRDSGGQAWYAVKALPKTGKPQVPGHEDEEEVEEPDDEEGIMRAVKYLDEIVKEELEKLGGDESRLVVGGFSQGCAVSTVWGLVGLHRGNCAGIVGLSGYFPLAARIESIRKEMGGGEDVRDGKCWFMAHGVKDMLVPVRLFGEGMRKLEGFVDKERIEGHVYETMTHSTAPAELRDLLAYLSGVVPP